MIAPAACGGDDDDGDDGTTADAGDDDGGDDGEPDAGDDDGGDDGEPDAGDDAGTPEGDQYLLGLAITADAGKLGMLNAAVRLIATINLDGATADITLQPVNAPECFEEMPEMSGVPAGEPREEADVAIGKDGSFELVLDQAVLAAGTVGSDNPISCGAEITSDLTVTGTVQKTGPCGEVAGEIVLPISATIVEGSFGSAVIDPPGTTGPDLPVPPDLPTECAK
jgi:hypothetical protein